ncbi:MAG: DMT family transporter [Pseudomonadota bacterium]
MTAAAAARRTGLLCLLATTLGWGLNWPAMRHLTQELPPLVARGSSGLVAALLLGLLSVALGHSLRLPRALWVRLPLVSLVNVFAWQGFSTLSLRWLNAGQGALLVYTMPVWAMLFAWPLLHERPTPRSLAALALCGGGLWLFFGASGLPLDAGHLAGIGFALAAATIFAAGTVAMQPIAGLPPLTLVTWQLFFGCLPMLLIGLAFEQPHWAGVTPLGWWLYAYMTVVPMGVCYIAWFAALRRVPATTATAATLLTPVVGVVAGAVVLGEPFGWRQVLALGLALAGIGLALRRGAAPRARARQPRTRQVQDGSPATRSE